MSRYLDTSALVKLVVVEQHSEALRRAVGGVVQLSTSGLARTELRRAVRRQAPRTRQEAEVLLAGLRLLPLTDALLDQAGRLEVPEVPFLRSLDAVHLVSARLLPDVEVITYDDRMAEAARALGLAVLTPHD